VAIRRVVVPVFLVAGILASPAAAPPVSASTSCSWSVVPTPSPGGLASASLSGVAAFLASDVWVVGALFDYLTLSEHWDGTAWTVVDTPNPGPYENIINAVGGSSTDDLWAVGFYRPHGKYPYPASTLILHWDGTSWTVVPGPNPSRVNALIAVDAVSPDDVWAVGTATDRSGVASTLIEHWDGSAWSVVPSQNPGSGGNRLLGVSASSASDVWAVGRATGQNDQTLIEHWDGSAWSVVPSPSPGKTGSELHAVVSVSASDAWAVGQTNDKQGTRSLSEHWDGSAWSVVQVPDVAPGYSLMPAVDASGPSDVWAMGSGPEGSNPETKHLDGTSWKVVPSVGVGVGYTPFLKAVADLAPNDVWAVGDAEGDVFDDYYFGPLPLVEHWDGAKWSSLPSPAVGAFSGLNAVSAAGEDAVWAVGNSDDGLVVERWNGTAWTVTGPRTGAGDQWTGVEPISPSEVWVVGFDPGGSGGETEEPLVEHWNGSHWKFALLPQPSQRASDVASVAISGTSANDVWAVGDWFGGAVSPRPLIEHWNGKKWTPLQGPSVQGTLTDVLALSPRNAWAVGEQGRSEKRTLIEHWDGSKWTVVPSPSPHPKADRLNGVGGTAHSLWAVGSSRNGLLVLHRSGGAWHTATVADPGGTPASLADVTVSHGAVWAVGEAGDQALVEHRAAGAWQVEDVAFPGETSHLEGITVVPGSSDLWAVGTYFGDDQFKTLAMHCS